jgi:hypothetical protein
MASMKAKLGQNPSQQKQFVPGAPAQQRSGPAPDAPKAPTK